MTAYDVLMDQIERAKRRSIPILAITTPDSMVLANRLAGKLNDYTIEVKDENQKKVPQPITVLCWDIVRGMFAMSDLKPSGEMGSQWLANNKVGNGPPGVGSLQEALEYALGLPVNSVLFIHQANRWLDESSPDCRAAIQAVVNLRDAFSASQRMLVLLSPQLSLPAEFRQDAIMLDDPLPDHPTLVSMFDRDKTLGGIVNKPEDRDRLASFTCGLSYFGASQALYLSAKRDKQDKVYIDEEELRSMRHNMIRSNPGLSIVNKDHTFENVAGVEYMKSLLTKIMQGKDPPRMIVNLEEIEEALAGAKGDSSGTSQDQLGVILDEMETNKDRGMVIFGVPGCTKSFLAQCVGKTFGVDTVKLDLGGLKHEHVGRSEQNVRNAMKVLNAVSGGKKLWIATCNGVSNLTPALLRRFTYGVFYFDLPSPQEKAGIWKSQFKMLKLPPNITKGWETIDTTDWSGADIRNCCINAYDFNVNITIAAKDISPAAKQKPEILHGMRLQAHEKMKDASSGEYFKLKDVQATTKLYTDANRLNI